MSQEDCSNVQTHVDDGAELTQLDGSPLTEEDLARLAENLFLEFDRGEAASGK